MLSLIPTMATFAALIIWNVSIRWWPIYPGVKVDIDVINNDFHAEFTLLDIQISARVKPYRTHNTGNLFIWPCGLPAMPCCVQVCRKRWWTRGPYSTVKQPRACSRVKVKGGRGRWKRTTPARLYTLYFLFRRGLSSLYRWIWNVPRVGLVKLYIKEINLGAIMGINSLSSTIKTTNLFYEKTLIIVIDFRSSLFYRLIFTL